jgi:iron complex outermembrane receptor protein
LGTTLLATGFVVPAVAQNAPASVARTMSIPAGPLTTALNRLAAQTGMQVLFDASIARGKTTGGAHGELTANQALSAILSGTGLVARATGPNAITIVSPSSAGGAAPAGAISLDTIDVQGETAGGPVQGYVANRSATATKTDTPLIEVPQSISVIGAEQIRDQKIISKLDEILNYTPGVITSNFGQDHGDDWFMIRGFQAQNNVFLDGLQLFSASFTSWKLPPFNLERVEVLRGPAAMMYGGSAPGGLVNAVSKLPPAEHLGFIEAGVNNFGNAYTQFDFGGPVATEPGTGKVLYRIVGQVNRGGTQTNFVPDDSYFIAPSVTFLPDVDTRLTVLALASQNKTMLFGFLPYIGTVVDAPFGRIPTNLFSGDPSIGYHNKQQKMVGYQFEKHLSENATFRQNGRIANLVVDYNALFGGGYATTPADATILRNYFVARNNATQLSQDSQFEYRFATGPVRHTALVGLDLRHYTLDDKQGFGPATELNLLNPVYGVNPPFDGPFFRDGSITQRQAGLYLQDQIKWDRLTLVLSGRNDWVSQIDRNFGTAVDRQDSKFSGRAGMIYNFDNGVAPYVSYATTYNPLPFTNAAGFLLLPETGAQTEVGMKYQPTGLNARFGIALFDLKRTNALTTDPNNPLFQRQTGEVTSRGVELEAVANITRDFKVVANYTNYQLFISKDLDPTLIGSVPVSVPRQTASFWTDYTFREGPLDGFGLGGGVRYVGSSFADTANLIVVPSRALGDLAVHYEWANNWRAAVNIMNVADTTYVSGCGSFNLCYYGDRRRITGSLSYKW